MKSTWLRRNLKTKYPQYQEKNTQFFKKHLTSCNQTFTIFQNYTKLTINVGKYLLIRHPLLQKRRSHTPLVKPWFCLVKHKSVPFICKYSWMMNRNRCRRYKGINRTNKFLYKICSAVERKYNVAHMAQLLVFVRFCFNNTNSGIAI